MGARALAKAIASALARQLGGVGAGAPAWSPSSLFASGEQGVWYDPSDFSTMFQDSAGTTPVTAVGQPVGKILDKSGRGNHASQSTAAARPVLQQDGGGKYYLAFDGVDDGLVTSNINFTGTDKMTVVAGVTKLADNNGLVAELGTSAATVDGTFSMQAGAGSTANYTFELRGTAACGYRAPSPAAPNTSVVTGLLDIAGADRSTEIIPRINGVLAGAPTGGAFGPAGTGNFISAPLYIGRRAGTTQPFVGSIYGLIVRGAAAADPSAAEAWMNSKMGAY